MCRLPSRPIYSLLSVSSLAGTLPQKIGRPTVLSTNKLTNILATTVRKYSSDTKSIENALTGKEFRSRRAVFYVPGGEERKIKSSLKLKADCIVYDLEDGVAFNRKGVAREMVFDTLEASELGRFERAVRINSVGSGLELDDLNVILRSTHLQAIVIPKVQSAKDIQFVSRMIDSVAKETTRASIRLIGSIESALGIMNLKEIATSDGRLDALIFAAEDYCADLGLTRTSSRKEFLYARQAIVTAACAYGLQAIDLVCLDYKNDAILAEECQEGREMGFVGKQAIHPQQVDIIHKTFLPDKKDINRAVKILNGYKEHSEKGIGVFSLDGKMIDLPMVKWAQRMISRVKAVDMPIPDVETTINSGKA
ncbi:8989_t:CDS:10 [Paraglomus occultum]|uniref:8989_t:CDS:1 n=1 Tax=Paraglomus occultum TaxID=144539 RepID=A0A9N9EXD9_9GLOM|nr:8989_t:CDS:10 [Paraglomus occultum]